MKSTSFNIFYTDDDTDDLDIFKHAAKEISSDVQVITQDNGDELIEMLKNPPPYPSVIFLDLNMPRKDGYEVLKEIRDIEQIRNFRVVIFSTSDDEKIISTTRQLGADLFVTKPPTFNLLKKVIRHIMSIDWSRFSASEENYVYRTN